MKRTLFVLGAALLFGGGLLQAEPKPGRADPANYLLYRSTDIAVGTNKLANSTFIHKVIVSSPSAVDYSTWSVLTVYNANGAASNPLFEVQMATIETVGPAEWTFDVYASSGLTVNLTTGNSVVSDIPGYATIVYGNVGGKTGGYKIWRSSYMVADTSTHTIKGGPVILHKVSVLKKGTGTSNLRIYNQNSGTPNTNAISAQIDLTDTAREYIYDMVLSSGLTVNCDQAGTVNPYFMLFFRTGLPNDYEVWNATYTTGTASLRSIFAGRGVFGGVVNGDSVAASELIVYDSNGVASRPLTRLDGVTSFSRIMYDVNVSSGLTISSLGTSPYTILYRRMK